MANDRYEIIETADGWAYKIGDAVSDNYPSRQAALIHADLAVGTPGAVKPVDPNSAPEVEEQFDKPTPIIGEGSA
ncbi:hypothetical protein [Chenggangzhangella methanolivorans]|uniref:DUF2188 domain-containing protein n=1 Tax=Chenggangzhangella methanolivorans TaxID=1437009 RepID=A0A9E6ULY8_9HYPH|nr:hypothetical protein [Chenggangzhangella methanolivorans]QZO01097.1 hypothetical protein K6K41_05850 [Chenggangzhangella methanolivorans]